MIYFFEVSSTASDTDIVLRDEVICVPGLQITGMAI
jgi:hypothetical protein